jgi:aminoglycoside phosphotransferase family enzyme
VSELKYLRLECERIGGPEVGRLTLETYCERTADRPPVELLEFYRIYHSTVRARVAIGHLQDPAIRDVAKWVARAEQYLAMAA